MNAQLTQGQKILVARCWKTKKRRKSSRSFDAKRSSLHALRPPILRHGANKLASRRREAGQAAWRGSLGMVCQFIWERPN